MRSVLALTVLGLLSLAALSCRETGAPPPAKAPDVPLIVPEEASLPEEFLTENIWKQLVRDGILPAEVESAPVTEYRIYSRAGPQRHLKGMKKPQAAPIN